MTVVAIANHIYFKAFGSPLPVKRDREVYEQVLVKYFVC